MNIRLEQFMRAEKLNSAKLAEILQIQPSSISHLLSGRNRPGFDFISKLMLMFPDINPDWLINGLGDMYRHKTTEKTDPVTIVTELTSDSTAPSYVADNEPYSSITDVNDPKEEPTPTVVNIENSEKQMKPESEKVEKIVIFYPDNSFEIFHQRN